MPDRVVIDKSGANLAGLQAVNVILKFTGNGRTIDVRQVPDQPGALFRRGESLGFSSPLA